MGEAKRSLLGELLKNNGLITDAQLNEALRRQQGNSDMLGEILIAMEAITRGQLAQMLEAQQRLVGAGPVGGLRVLIVEDDMELSRTLRDGFRNAGFRTQIALSGAEAIALILSTEARPPQVIVLDLGLPRFSGIDVLAALRKNEKTKTLPVIVLTGHTDAEEQARAEALGISAYFQKPTPLPELMRAVQQAAR